MFQSFKQIDFRHQLLFLTTGHFLKFDLFANKYFTISDSFDLFDDAEWTLANLLEEDILFHI